MATCLADGYLTRAHASVPTGGILPRATGGVIWSNLIRVRDFPIIQLIPVTRCHGGAALGVTFSLPLQLTRHCSAPVIRPRPRTIDFLGMTTNPRTRLNFVLDCAFYSLRVCRAPPEGHPALGETIASGGAEPLQSFKKSGTGQSRLAPSTIAAVEELCGSDLYTNRPPALTATYYGSGPSFYTAWHKGLMACQSSASAKGPNDVAFCPIATVEHDNRYLFWGIDTPLCASGSACTATTLEMNQGPLHAYRIPGDKEPQPYCLLCIREDVEGLVMSVEAKSKSAGCVPIVTPPFKNPVGPGGYDESAFGVTPHNQSVFVGNTWIVKASGTLKVRLDPATRRCFVDQGPLVYGSKNG